VISTTGWLKDAYCRPFVENKSVDELADEMIRDLTEGMSQTRIRAGVIKIATSLNKVTPAEEKVILAAARAARATGAPIITHTEAGTMAREQVEMLTAQGVEASRICLSHLDRHVRWDEHYAVVSWGANLIYDQISKEKYVPDAQRVELVKRMINEGFGDQIMLAGDMSRKSYWPAYGTGGGPGLTYILWRFVPWLRSAGLSNDAIHKLMVSNPARCLQWAN
jgi:phosphotriesterase-related protein